MRKSEIETIEHEINHKLIHNLCCAPVERCGTAQDGLGDDGSQTAKINLHNTH